MTLLTWVRPNPFDVRTVLLAKHAQHVVLIHFPIALFVAAVFFDLIAFWTKRRAFADAAYYNLLVAALATIPTLVAGVVAWQLQLEGQRLKGILLQHFVLGILSGTLICLVWCLHFRARKKMAEPPAYRFLIEIIAVLVVMTTRSPGRLFERRQCSRLKTLSTNFREENRGRKGVAHLPFELRRYKAS